MRLRKINFRPLFGLALLFFIHFYSPWISADNPASPDKPHIVLLSMGGTIASKGDTRLNLANYGGKGMRLGPQELLDVLPELADVARVTTEDFRRPVDAVGGITFEYLFKVARRLQELADDPTVDGVVITIGTYTVTEATWFMNLVVQTRKPVVFVGAQRPWTALSSDGPLNLYNAVRVAASPVAAGKGVLHVMNDTIHGARDVDKTSAYRVEAFKSVDLGPLGFADHDKVIFYRMPLRRHTISSEFSIRKLDLVTLPKVEIFYSYIEAPAYIIESFVEHGVKGIILDGGPSAGEQTEAIKRAQQKGVVVVASARTRGGRVINTKRRRELGIIPGDNLVPEKARILLRLALTSTSDREEIKRIFNEY